MEHINLIESFSEFKEFKNIDRTTMQRILEDVFKSMIAKRFGTSDNYDVIINVDKGDLEIWRSRTIVEDGDVENSNIEISLSEAIKIEPDFEVGEEVSEPFFMKDFARREILTIRQTLVSKVQEYEKDSEYRKYKDKIGEIITGEVYQIWKKEILVIDDDGIELILPKAEQINGDYFHKGESIRAVVLKVEIRNNLPFIIISRTSPIFLERLFELEVPEVRDGLITIKKIVREPGERAKVAVESYDERIDPVGACVGMKGSRIHGIVHELKNENIDVINYTTNTSLYITRCLSPAKIAGIKLDNENMKAEVTLKPDQVSLAIGKGGHNIKLAGRLTNYDIEVFREVDTSYEDIVLQEFDDEIDQWIIDEFKNIGCDTARSVLDREAQFLIKHTDLEEETINEVIRILKSELDQE